MLEEKVHYYFSGHKICFCYLELIVRQVLETNLRGKRITEDIKEGWFDRKHKIYFDG